MKVGWLNSCLRFIPESIEEQNALAVLFEGLGSDSSATSPTYKLPEKLVRNEKEVQQPG